LKPWNVRITAKFRGARRAALSFVFVTALLDSLALGVIIPVQAPLISSFVGGDTAQAADILGSFGAVWATIRFVCSPLIGVLSDRYGRRPVLLLSNSGLGLDYILMAVASNLVLLFIGQMLSGITAASFSAAGAYIADLTPTDKRAASFGLLGSAFGLGFILGPALGGVLGSIEPRLPFWVLRRSAWPMPSTAYLYWPNRCRRNADHGSPGDGRIRSLHWSSCAGVLNCSASPAALSRTFLPTRCCRASSCCRGLPIAGRCSGSVLRSWRSGV
jgi:multidrug resistance protein